MNFPRRKKAKPSPTIDSQSSVPVAANRKIKNAVKVVNEEGVKFDSRLEKYLYDLLKQYGIPFEFQRCYLLQEKFRFRGELIRPITLTVDFWLPGLNVIIDTKGFQTEQSKIKMKLLKWNLLNNADVAVNLDPPQILMPSNKTKCNDVALLLKARMT